VFVFPSDMFIDNLKAGRQPVIGVHETLALSGAAA
jgi:hypothetical protein